MHMAEQADTNDQALLADRRAEPRTASVYRPVIIETDGYTGFCLIRNLSDRGLQGVIYADLSEGEPINVQFATGLEVSGQIAWTRDRHIGVSFDIAINTTEVLEDLGRSRLGDKINRALRVSVDTAGVVTTGDERQTPVLVHDISQRGVKITAPFVRVGDQVTIYLDTLGNRKADVRWFQGGFAGLNFVTPIAFEELASWVISVATAR